MFNDILEPKNDIYAEKQELQTVQKLRFFQRG